MGEFHDAVSTLLEAFAHGISIIKIQRCRRKKEHMPIDPRKKSAESHLSKSLKKNRTEVKTAYGKDLVRFGPGFAAGDGKFVLLIRSKSMLKPYSRSPLLPLHNSHSSQCRASLRHRTLHSRPKYFNRLPGPSQPLQRISYPSHRNLLPTLTTAIPFLPCPKPLPPNQASRKACSQAKDKEILFSSRQS